MTPERDNRSKGSRDRPAKGRRIPARTGCREAGGMCGAGMNEVRGVVHTRGQLA